jgi:hypothetical protein
MAKIPRVRERTATPEELEEDRRRCLAAKEKAPTPVPNPAAENEGNLCACLVTFAAWRKCCVCSRPVLFVDARCKADSDVECPTCHGIRRNLARRLRQMPVLERVGLHLRALFLVANDNHEVTNAS